MADPGYIRIRNIWIGVGFRWWLFAGIIISFSVFRAHHSWELPREILFYFMFVGIVLLHGVFGILNAGMTFSWQNIALDYRPPMWVHNAGLVMGGAFGVPFGIAGGTLAWLLTNEYLSSEIRYFWALSWGSGFGFLIGAWTGMRAWKVVNKTLNG